MQTRGALVATVSISRTATVAPAAAPLVVITSRSLWPLAASPGIATRLNRPLDRLWRIGLPALVRGPLSAIAPPAPHAVLAAPVTVHLHGAPGPWQVTVQRLGPCLALLFEPGAAAPDHELAAGLMADAANAAELIALAGRPDAAAAALAVMVGRLPGIDGVVVQWRRDDDTLAPVARWGARLPPVSPPDIWWRRADQAALCETADARQPVPELVAGPGVRLPGDLPPLALAGADPPGDRDLRHRLLVPMAVGPRLAGLVHAAGRCPRRRTGAERQALMLLGRTVAALAADRPASPAWLTRALAPAQVSPPVSLGG